MVCTNVGQYMSRLRAKVIYSKTNNERGVGRMYTLIEGYDEYPKGRLYHCYVFQADTLETLYKAYGTTHANAQQRALDFISETEAMREGDNYRQVDIEHIIEKENGKNI